MVENVAAGYVDPYVGGGTKDFAPYVLMIIALMIRPYGIFGKRHHRKDLSVIHRECGVLKTELRSGHGALPAAHRALDGGGASRCCSSSVLPLTLHEYYLSIGNLVWIAVIGALGLNILVGYTGQVSISHGAFMSVGAYTAANLATRLDSPWPVNHPRGRAHGGGGGGDRRHPSPAHQGALSGHRDAGQASSSSSGSSTT